MLGLFILSKFFLILSVFCSITVMNRIFFNIFTVAYRWNCFYFYMLNVGRADRNRSFSEVRIAQKMSKGQLLCTIFAPFKSPCRYKPLASWSRRSTLLPVLMRLLKVSGAISVRPGGWSTVEIRLNGLEKSIKIHETNFDHSLNFFVTRITNFLFY